MRVLITGGTGFIGSKLVPKLLAKGHELVVVSRQPKRAETSLPDAVRAVSWESLAEAGPIDAVVHMAGESVAGRWSSGKRKAILDSRVKPTMKLVQWMKSTDTPPKVFISASAIGFYGDCGEQAVDESNAPGEGFLPEVCTAWEHAAAAAEEAGITTARLRIGLVLHPDGGVLERMVPIFKLGGGGSLGPGTQYWSWIHLEDVIGMIMHLLAHPLSGPINATAPTPVTQKTFAKTLGKVIRRPAFLPAPAFVLKAMLGGFSEEILMSRRVIPTRAEQIGYAFQFRTLQAALEDLLPRK